MKIKRFLNIGLAGLFLANVAYAQSYQFDFSEKKKVEKGVIQISSDSIYPCKGGYGYDFYGKRYDCVEESVGREWIA